MPVGVATNNSSDSQYHSSSDEEEERSAHNNDSECEEEPESKCNDGKGMKLTVTFVGLFPRLKTGEKRRANAKPPTITVVVYVHERWTFPYALSEILKKVGRRDLLRGGTDRKGQLLDATPFFIEYTVPRTTSKDVALKSEKDWETFVEEVAEKASAQGKLIFTEKQTPQSSNAADSDAEEGENNDTNTKKKKKTSHTPNVEEDHQDEIIKELTALYLCEDGKCSHKGACWVHAESSKHVRLTHLHLRTWAAAIASKNAGVDKETPPAIKLFDPEVPNSDADIASMAARRRAAAAPAPPAQNIHLSFDGLAELLTGAKKTNAVPSPKKAADYSHMPKLELVEFCEHYGISAALKLKLEAICVDGPHALCWISNEAL